MAISCNDKDQISSIYIYIYIYGSDGLGMIGMVIRKLNWMLFGGWDSGNYPQTKICRFQQTH